MTALVTLNNFQHIDQYLHADLPQIGVMDGGHEESLRNVIEVSRSHYWSLSSLAKIFRDGSKFLVIQFAFPPIQTCIVGCSSIKVTRIDIPSLWGQEVAYNTKLGTWPRCQRMEVNRRTVAILVVVVLFLVIVADFGLKVDETADRRPSVASLNQNKREYN